MQSSQKSYLLGTITVLFWSTVATAFKLSLASLSVYQLLVIACLTSTLVLLLILLLTGKLKSLRGQFYSLLKPSLFMGWLNPFFYYLVLLEAYDRLPAQVAQPINYTWVIVLTIMSVFFLKQKVSKKDIIAGVVCYAGVAVISIQGGTENPVALNYSGVILAVLSTLIWAGYWTLNIKDKRDPVIGLFLNFLVAVPLVLVACAVFSDFNFPLSPGLFFSVYIGLFEMSLAFLCWSFALKLAENTSKVSNLVFLSPFLSLILIHFVLGEEIYPTTYAGLMLIMGGLAIQKVTMYRKSWNEQS